LYEKKHVNTYFWRTFSGVEIDYVEESTNSLYAFGFKFGKSTMKPPKYWVENYSQEYKLINKQNYREFII